MSSPTEFETAPDEFVDSLQDNISGATTEVNGETGEREKTTEESTAADIADIKSESERVDSNNGTEKSTEGAIETSDNGEASEVARDASAEKDVQESKGAKKLIFHDISFYLNRDASAHDSVNEADKLGHLIETNGGHILTELPQGSTVSSNVFVVSPYNDSKLPTVTPTYIRACCQNNTLLKIENYLVPFDEFRSVIDSQLHEEPNSDKHNYQNNEVYAENDVSNADAESKQNIGHDLGTKENTTEGTGAGSTQHQQSETGVAVNIGNNNTKPEPKEQMAADNQLHKNEQPLAEIVDHVPAKTNNGQEVQNDQQGSYQIQQPENAQVVNGNDSNAFDSTRTMLARANMPTHNKASFTEAEDEFILDVVRKNPTRRTTHTLYDEISHYVPNHTGNSIRHRFRVYLSKRLEFVYEVDKYGKLIRDDNGNLIKTKILPPSIKKKFTADEDYSLAVGIKKQFYRDLYQIDPDTGVSLITDEDSPTAVAKRNMTMDPNHVPGTEPSFTDYRVHDRRGPIAREFFKQFGESHATHTENAWRDRFRKFLLAYGIDNYIEYYEGEKSRGNIPEPMKNLTNRVKRPGIPTPGNYNSAAKRARIYGSERDGQPSTSQSEAVTAATAAAAVNASGNANQIESGNGHYAVPESELLDEDTMNFISSIRNDLNKFDSSIPFEYPQEIADAIRNDFSNEEAEYDDIDPDTIPFPPEIASIDLFLPQFFRMSSTREFLEKVHEVISRDYEPSQAEKLVQDLCDEAGVRKTFSTSILTALSGDLMVFPRYFLNMFKHNMNPPSNVPGIWTREDDRMLRGNKEEDIRILTKRHGSGRMEMRRKFVEKDLI